MWIHGDLLGQRKKKEWKEHEFIPHVFKSKMLHRFYIRWKDESRWIKTKISWTHCAIYSFQQWSSFSFISIFLGRSFGFALLFNQRRGWSDYMVTIFNAYLFDTIHFPHSFYFEANWFRKIANGTGYSLTFLTTKGPMKKLFPFKHLFYERLRTN